MLKCDIYGDTLKQMIHMKWHHLIEVHDFVCCDLNSMKSEMIQRNLIQGGRKKRTHVCVRTHTHTYIYFVQEHTIAEDKFGYE
jgi:hypothetical protein